MNLFMLSGLSCGICCILLSFIAFIFGSKKIHKVLGYFNLAVAVWGIGGFIVGISVDEETAIFGWKFAHIGGMFVSILFLHLVCIFCKVWPRWLMIFGYSQAIIFNLLSWGTDKFINKVRYVYGLYYNDTTFLFALAVFSYLLLAVCGFFELVKFFKKVQDKKNVRMQTLYIFFGFLVGFAGGTSTFAPEFGIDIGYPLGNFGITLYSLIVTYAVLRYRLLDIRVAMTRAGLFVLVYSVVLVVPFFLERRFSGTSAWWVPVLVALGLASGGGAVYNLLRRKAEDVLLKKQKRYQKTLIQAAKGMVRIKDVKKLVSLCIHIITKAVGVRSASVFLIEKDHETYRLKDWRGINGDDFGELVLKADNFLIQKLFKLQSPIIVEEFLPEKGDGLQPSDVDVVREMVDKLKVDLVVPAFTSERLVGFFALGEKKTKDIFTADDLAVFSTLANQAALAMENCMYLEEFREAQDRIFRADKLATVGAMAEGVSHQLNNRLQAFSAVGGDIKDVMETMIEQKPHLEEDVKADLDYCVSGLSKLEQNVEHSAQIIRGVLNYARTEKDTSFRFFDITTMIDTAKDLLKVKHKVKDFEPIVNRIENMPDVWGSPAQLAEAVFNCIDNGFEAIMEKEAIFKREGLPVEEKKLEISFIVKPNKLVLKIQDNGIGIKNDNRKKDVRPVLHHQVIRKIWKQA